MNTVGCRAGLLNPPCLPIFISLVQPAPQHEEFFRACAAAGMQANPDFNNWSRPQVDGPAPCARVGTFPLY